MTQMIIKQSIKESQRKKYCYSIRAKSSYLYLWIELIETMAVSYKWHQISITQALI
jgi:hypothetical protein